MKKEDSSSKMIWSQKYSLLAPWFGAIISQIKRDCKTDHLSVDPHFIQAHFAGKPVARISLEEMRSVYLQRVLSGHEQLAEFIANRWIFRNMKIYSFFEKELVQKISNFDQIHQLPLEIIEPVIEKAIPEFGVEMVFCFIVLNDVGLPESLFEKIQKEAIQKASSEERTSLQLDEEEHLIQSLKKEIAILKERHQKKIVELQRTHAQEIKRLSNQIKTHTSSSPG